jgi:glycosyltransferase involved in cell wall biosynthesis
MFNVKKMKIAFVIHGLSMGGAEKFLIYLVNRLSDIGHDPIIITLSNDKTLLHEVNKNVTVITILRKHKFDLSVTAKIRKTLVAHEIDSVFCINMFSFFLTKLGLLFNKNIQFYLSLHSTDPVSFKNHIANYIYFRFVNRKDIVVYICQNQKNFLKRKYFISSFHDEVIYNGIDTAFFDPALFSDFNAQLLRDQYGISSSDMLILKVARLRIEKGHIDAIQALSILHTQFSLKAHLLFVGNGDEPFITSLKDLTRKSGLDGFVHFSGIQSDVRKFYMISSIFTLTSHSIETFSLAALEAMSFSLPCSLTDIGGANEMISEGINGFLTQPHNSFSIAESWNHLLNGQFDKQQIRGLVLQQFTSNKMLDQYINLLKQNSIQFNN